MSENEQLDWVYEGEFSIQRIRSRFLEKRNRVNDISLKDKLKSWWMNIESY